MGKLLIGEIMGPQGMQGEPGPQGLRGEKGEPGDAPYISQDTGTWWVGDTDTGVQAQGEPGRDGVDGTQGTPGADGADGAPGVPGQAATIEIGEVTTVGSEEDANVENTGTPNAARLNFYIPRGLTGDITGQSLYEYALATGFIGTYDDWLHEYLGQQTGLMWCSGYLQERSFVANITGTFTLVATDGYADLLVDNKLIAPQSGVYSLFMSAGTWGVSTGTHWNEMSFYSTDGTRKSNAQYYASGYTVPGGVMICKADAGDYFTLGMSTNTAKSGYYTSTSAPKFHFAQLWRDAV